MKLTGWLWNLGEMLFLSSSSSPPPSPLSVLHFGKINVNFARKIYVRVSYFIKILFDDIKIIRMVRLNYNRLFPTFYGGILLFL